MFRFDRMFVDLVVVVFRVIFTIFRIPIIDILVTIKFVGNIGIVV